MRTPPRTLIAIALVGAVGAAASIAAPAFAQDGYRKAAKRYDELSKNHDDPGNRDRRYAILDLFPFRTEKPCRKLLRNAFDDEKTIANRVAVVHVLSGSGAPKSLDYLVKAFKKERARAPIIALGAGLGFTPDDEKSRAAMAKQAIKHLKRAKDDLRMSLIDGLGQIGHPSALPALLGLAKLSTDEWFTRDVALGHVGGDGALATLQEDAAHPLPEIRLGAAFGLAAMGTEGAIGTLMTMLSDSDARVIRTAAAKLAEAAHKDAAPAMAKALGDAVTLRTREELRVALTTLLGRDLGHDAEAWAKLAAGDNPPPPKDLPEMTKVFGIPVASDSFAVLIDTSRSTSWLDRLARIRSECVGFIDALAPDATFVLARAARQFTPYQESFVTEPQRADAQAWIDELLPGGGLDMRLALTETLTRFPSADTIVILTDSHPWGAGRSSGSRETMEIFRRLNATRQVKLIIALVMPGGRNEASERSQPEIDERIDYLTEMAEDSGGAFVHVSE